nr:hypothetical protein [Tanacetum cinerariifolium]
MEKIRKDKVIRSQKSKVNPGKVRVNLEKVNVKPGKAEAEKAKKIQTLKIVYLSKKQQGLILQLGESATPGPFLPVVKTCITQGR